MKDKIMELFDLWGDTISEEEIRGAYPMERKEFYSLLMDMFKEGLIYPEVVDYGKQEVQWVKKLKIFEHKLDHAKFQIFSGYMGMIRIEVGSALDERQPLLSSILMDREDLGRLHKEIGEYLYPVKQIFPQEVHGDPQTDWMEQASFKYQFRDRVKWVGAKANGSGEVIEGHRAPDQKASYSIRVDCGWDVVVVVPEELLEKIDDSSI